MAPLLLKGVKIVEFVHMVMGPSTGLVLADLGADVVKVEPAPEGTTPAVLVAPAAGSLRS